MNKKLTGKTLTQFEANRDVWQEVLNSVRKIKAGGEKRTKAEVKSYVGRVRFTMQMYSDPYSYIVFT